MYDISYKNTTIQCKANESVLDAFIRNQVEVPFSCRNGSCQVCLMRATAGKIPPAAQRNVKTVLQQTQHFLPCKCIPQTDMVLADASDDLLYMKSHVNQKRLLSDDICELVIDLPTDVAYRAGQFINIRRCERKQTARSYSLVYPCDHSQQITIHIKKVRQGAFSQWVFDQATAGDSVEVNLPLGEACHSNDMNFKQKIIICTGTGQGVAAGLATDIINSGFAGEVVMIHQCKNQEACYDFDLLTQLRQSAQQFTYHQLTGTDASAITSKLQSLNIDPQQTELYQYGNPQVVSAVKAFVQQLGMADKDLYCDPFEHSHTVDELQSRMDDMQYEEESPRTDTVDLALWQSLDNGRLLKEILDHFYTRVLKDDILAPFFTGVTKSHIVGKQYAFMTQYLTGEDVYFGDRPRNAHHFMVISHEIFNHRERLFSNSCVACGLPTAARLKLLAINESYRSMIVKSKVWPRISNGIIKPLKGFEDLTLDIGTVCDECSNLLEAGDTVRYHALVGKIYCMQCSQDS